MSSILLGFDELTGKQHYLTEVTHTHNRTHARFFPFQSKRSYGFVKVCMETFLPLGIWYIHSFRDFRRGASHFGDLNIEYRACIMATLFWAEFSQVWIEWPPTARWCQADVQTLPGIHIDQQFGTRRCVSFSQSLTQGLGQIYFNVKYVVIIDLQYACLVIVHWCSILTHWGRDKMADISLTTFQMQIPMVQLKNFQHWFR